MKTKIHTYDFDLKDEGQAYAWARLREELVKDIGLERRMKAITVNPSERLKFEPDEVIELDTEFLFSDQWNTKATAHHPNGARVFDWWQEAIFYNGSENKTRKRGHFLEITKEMREIREHTLKCGYCGKQYLDKDTPRLGEGLRFCTACLDSEYLKAEDLHLLRLLPVVEGFPERLPLTPYEKDTLMHAYVYAQTEAKGSRAKAIREKSIAKVHAKYEKDVAAAKKERDGKVWLYEHDISLDDVIFYTHRENFCIGWRDGFDPEVADVFEEKLKDFPFEIEIKRR